MSTQFHVDTAQIQAGSAEISRLSGQIESDVARMMARLQSLESAWTGAASTNFQATMTRWNATQRQVRESLVEINTMLGRAGEGYSQVEAANAAMFRS